MTKELLDEHKVLQIFKGSNATCCRFKHKGMDTCDRQRLVVPMLGMYAYVHANRHAPCCLSQCDALTLKLSSFAPGRDRSDLEVLAEDINKNKEDVFPRTFEFHSLDENGNDKCEELPLFHNLAKELGNIWITVMRLDGR